MAFQLLVRNDNLVSLNGLKDQVSATFVNTATVNLTVTDTTNRVIAGPIAMPYVTGSTGNYQAILPASTPLQAGVSYRVTIQVTGPAVAEWDVPVTAEWRDALSP